MAALLEPPSERPRSLDFPLITNELRVHNARARLWNPFCGKPMVRVLLDRPWPVGVIELRGPTF